MPDVSKLLRVAMDDPSLQIPMCPVGTWKAEVRRITFKDKDKEGEKFKRKDDDSEFAIVNMFAIVMEPQGDVDQDKAKEFIKADGPRETPIKRTYFIDGKRAIGRFYNDCHALGIPAEGMSIESLAKSYSGGAGCMVEVTHREGDDGITREEAASIYPLEEN